MNKSKDIHIMCNMDAYKTNCFPTNLTHSPRVGDMIVVVDAFKKYYQEKKFPVMLEVKSVAHSELGVICDVHLSDSQSKFIKLNNIKIYG